MEWRILIEGKQLPSEKNLTFDFGSKRPREGELYLITTAPGETFLFRVDIVHYVPRRIHDILVTRLWMFEVISYNILRDGELVERHNRILNKKITGAVSCWCLSCKNEYLALPELPSICPSCGKLSVP